MPPALLLIALLQAAPLAAPPAAPLGAGPAARIIANPSATAQLQASVSAACGLDPQRQFDFLLGRWSLSPSDSLSELAKVNVRRVADGCALIEEAAPAQGTSATSLIVYDPGATLWRMVRISGDGELQTLEGGEQDGRMVLEGETSAPGKSGLVRLTWTREGETVRETEDASTDGKIWNPVFSHDLHPMP